MNLPAKLGWRLAVLRSKIVGRGAVGWGAVLWEICRGHPPVVNCDFRVSARENVLLLTAPNGVRIYWPAAFDHRFLALCYEEVYGPQSCVNELPGKVEVRRGDWVVDGGACEGFFTLYCLSRGASVACVEPNPPLAGALRETLAPYSREGRAVVVGAALGDAAGEVEFLPDYVHAGGSSFAAFSGGSAGRSVVRVPVVTLDGLVEALGVPRVDFVKLDVEGAERLVLLGAANTVRRCRPRWAVACYHRPDDYRSCRSCSGRPMKATGWRRKVPPLCAGGAA